MTVSELRSLPKEFDFRSKVNAVVPLYHAVETAHGYTVTVPDTDVVYSYSKPEFRRSLLDGRFVLA